MSNNAPRFDSAYLTRKRRQLIELRDGLRNASNAAEAEETDIKQESNSGSGEYEDEAQRLDLLERNGHLVVHDLERLARIERAVEKIAEGTYGFSDISGERIADDRLEAMPDAISTLAEQEASENVGNRPI